MSCSQLFAVWNEGYFLIEKAYQQTSDASVIPLNNQNVRLRLTIRNTTANQTSLISYINALGGTSTLNPIRDGQLIGAHYNLLFGFSTFDELKATYPPGDYNLSLTRTYSGSTVTLNPTYAFSGNWT